MVGDLKDAWAAKPLHRGHQGHAVGHAVRLLTPHLLRGRGEQAQLQLWPQPNLGTLPIMYACA